MADIDNVNIIELCNQSLGLLGAEGIVLDGTSQNHTYCELFYDNDRDEMLESHKWNFAKKRAYAIQTTNPLFGPDNAFTKPSDCLKVWSIDQDADAVFEVEGTLIVTDHGDAAPDWATATAYIVGQPVSNDDVTYVCKVAHTSGALDDEPGTGALTGTYWTSQSGDYKVLPVEYVYQNTSVTSWSYAFKRCVILRLAISLISPITQDSKTALNLQAMLYGSKTNLGYHQLAKSFDAQEGGAIAVSTNSFLDARR